MATETFDYFPEIDISKYEIPDSVSLQHEKEVDTYELKIKIHTNKGRTIHTFGEIKKFLKKIKDIERLEEVLDDDDYVYLYKWLQYKLKDRIY